MNEIPDNSKNINYKLFVLDPLSIIIKLAILSNKPIGTKFRVQDNVMYLQEPGYFQSICRIYYNANKTEIQYLYNPIHFACENFLCSRFTDKTPGIKKLFSCAINGLNKLKWKTLGKLDLLPRKNRLIGLTKCLHQSVISTLIK
jgi:hypothetical protein